MSRLKETLKEALREKTLRQVLGAAYETTSDQVKQNMLGVVENELDREIDKMVLEEVDRFNSNTPARKMNKWVLYIYAALNIILTILISYAVNKEAWPFVWGIGAAHVIVSFLPLIYSEK